MLKVQILVSFAILSKDELIFKKPLLWLDSLIVFKKLFMLAGIIIQLLDLISFDS